MIQKDFSRFSYQLDLANLPKDAPDVNYTMKFFKDKKQTAEHVLDHALFYDEARANKARFSVMEAFQDNDGVTIAFFIPKKEESGVALALAAELVCHKTSEEELIETFDEFSSKAQKYTRRLVDVKQGGPRF